MPMMITLMISLILILISFNMNLNPSFLFSLQVLQSSLC